MASLLEKKENNVVVLTIDVTKEDFAVAIQQSFQKNKNRFQIPGFRKGKAPYHMVKQYYGEGVLYDDAIDFAVSPAYAAAVKEHGLKIVSKPELDILDIGAEKGLKFTITVTEKPEVTLGAYLGVEAPYHFHDASQEDVQKELDRVLERNSRLVPIEDRPVAADDTVTINYEGFHDGVAFEGGKADGYDLKIGSNSFIPGFEEQLIGHSINEEFPISVTFPEEYHSEELKGKEVTFQIKLLAIKSRELPVLDDEFAKDVSEFDTLEEYKADILAKKQEQAKVHAVADFQNAVVKVACDNAVVEIPDCMVDTEVDQLADEQANRMKYQGIELEQYLQYVGQTMEDFRAGLVPVAKVRVKSNLVIEAIAKAENIVATDEDVDAEAEKMAAQYNMKKEELLARLGGNDGFIRESIIAQKAVDLITEAAIKVDFHDHGHEGHGDDDTDETNS
ncbi:MAG: trigger factor [Eubacteriales bacterium]